MSGRVLFEVRSFLEAIFSTHSDVIVEVVSAGMYPPIALLPHVISIGRFGYQTGTVCYFLGPCPGNPFFACFHFSALLAARNRLRSPGLQNTGRRNFPVRLHFNKDHMCRHTRVLQGKCLPTSAKFSRISAGATCSPFETSSATMFTLGRCHVSSYGGIVGIRLGHCPLRKLL